MPRTIEFGGREVQPDIRYLYDMEEVIYDQSWLREAENVPLYYMYRDLYRPEDREAILQNNIRYDITVMPPRRLGKELVKTKGHYHPKVNSMTYPELYGVLEGEAHYLLQRRKNQEVTRVILIKAEKGDRIIIPPNYGHVTINPSDRELKMANWVCRDFDSIYEPIQKKGGAAWFELVDRFVKNQNYSEAPELERFEASENDPFKKKIYKLIQDPEKLRFLIKPEKNKELFESLEY